MDPTPETPLVAQALPRSPGRLLGQLALLYAVVVCIVALADSTPFLDLTRALPVPLQLALRVGVLMLAGLGLVAFFVRGEPDPRASLGLTPIPAGRALGFGVIGFGIAHVASATMIFAYVVISRRSLLELASKRGAVFELISHTPAWMILPLAITVGFYEEVIFRGFVLRRLRELLGTVQALSPLRQDALAVLISSAMFGALHTYQGPSGIAQTFGAGAALGGLALWRRSIWPSIVAHALIDSFGLFVLHVLLPRLHETLHHLQHAAPK